MTPDLRDILAEFDVIVEDAEKAIEEEPVHQQQPEVRSNKTSWNDYLQTVK